MSCVKLSRHSTFLFAVCNDDETKSTPVHIALIGRAPIKRSGLFSEGAHPSLTIPGCPNQRLTAG